MDEMDGMDEMDEMDGLLFVLGAGTLLIGGVGVLTMMLDAVHDRRQENALVAGGTTQRPEVEQFVSLVKRG